MKGESNMDIITGWTRQVPEVLKELENEGRYRVKEEYIRIKNDNIADYYLNLYRWYTKKGREYVEIPETAEFPIWFSLAEDFRLQQIPNTVVLKVEIPREKALIIDIEKWEYRGNNMYVPKDSSDRKRFEENLRRYGIGDETSLVEEKGNFYPLLKKELIESWERLFTMPPSDFAKGYATIWELKKEWVKEVMQYE